MLEQLKNFVAKLSMPLARPALALKAPSHRTLALGATAAAAAALLWTLAHNPPLQTVGRGEVALRTNLFNGEVSRWRDGTVWLLPGVHELQRYSLRDQTWRAESLARAAGAAPAQSVEGLSLGVDLSVRWVIDVDKLATRNLPADIGRELIEPAVHGTVYPLLARHTVREIFSTKRAEIQQQIEAVLKARLAAEGVVVRAVQIGNVDLPADYKRGLDGLLAEGLATEKMRYTLELKDKRVKETELEATADRLRRESAAEAAAREQVIAARAQEEAMKHVLPFKQRQIEQRRLEAEAERQARVKLAEGAAQARRIEAQGEAEARQKLADAEAYRAARLGKVAAEQMAVEGVLISRHPLLIQKTLADRLSDKIRVIIAPPPESGGFIGSAIVGSLKQTVATDTATPEQ
jgi:regulator of protease activity HflC (stomatin/prohibitin superfamily)